MSIMEQKKKPPVALAVAAGRSRNTNQFTTTNRSDSAKQGRPVYTIRLRPEPGVDGIRALRALLKRALRAHRLRCISVEEARP
jgi:hypothetical protein